MKGDQGSRKGDQGTRMPGDQAKGERPSIAGPMVSWFPGSAVDDVLREECGVIGIVSGDGPAAPMAHLGLYSLQHRGQESAGIATSDGAGLWHHRGMGLVFQVFDADRIARLPGQLAVGHVRYSTMGSVRLENAQPLVVPSPWGPLALAHNGNLINAPQLRAELEAGGVEFAGTTDSEVIAHLIARTPEPVPEDAIASAMRRIEGAYTVVVLVAGRVLGFRDAHAIRPLAIGTTGRSWILASETCAFDHLGALPVRDVDPGNSSSWTLLVCDRSRCWRPAASRTASSSTSTSRGRTRCWPAAPSTWRGGAWAAFWPASIPRRPTW